MSTKSRPLRYLQLAEELKAMIADGNLQPGDRMPAFSEMRARFDASPLTVDKMYAQLEKEGLVVREARRGCFVAQPRPKTKTGVLGLLGVQPNRRTDAYFAQILGGAQQAAFAASCEILLLNSEVPVPWQKIDALLLPSSEAATLLKGKPSFLPCVSLLYRYPEMPSVTADDFDGARQATRALIGLGHQRIGYLTLTDHPVTRLRIAGYQQALHDAGINSSPDWLRTLEQNEDPQRYFREWGHSSMQRWLREGWRQLGITALLTQNDHVAAGALMALQEAGLQVPEDVSIVGFDDQVICEFTTPTLSSVTVPLAEIGAAGVRLLLRELDVTQDLSRSSTDGRGLSDEHDLNGSIVLPTRFHGRDSISSPR